VCVCVCVCVTDVVPRVWSPLVFPHEVCVSVCVPTTNLVFALVGLGGEEEERERDEGAKET
jgi:hypothetical protein